MSYQLPFTGDEVKKVLDGRYNSPIQDCVGDNYTVGSPLAMIGGSEYNFVCNGNTSNFKKFPEHITSIWDTATNIATFSEFLDTPEIVANVQFTFNPSSSSSGTITVMAYVNETVPIEIKSVVIPYKATATRSTGLITFYAGDATGFDVKNKGVFFTVESSGDGNLYDVALEIYRT